MPQQNGQSTPAADATKANPMPETPAIVAKFIAMADTPEAFAIQVAKTLIANGLLYVATSKSGETKFAKWTLGGVGDPKKDFRATYKLSPEQSRMLPLVQGVPMDLAFNVTLLDLVPDSSLERRNKDRVAELEDTESSLEARLAEVRRQKEAATARRG